MAYRYRKRNAVLAPIAALGCSVALSATEPGFLSGVRRVVVLGDSITYGGGYVVALEAFSVTRHPERRIDWLNLGLPSETVSGLSEPGHADGQFPRPGLHERLARVLTQTEPDLVLACYGMNDGIYHPFSEERFAAFQTGQRRLHAAVTATGARIVHVTPPTFDPVPIRDRTLPAGLGEYRQPYAGYNEVLDRYAEWLLAQRNEGWQVADAHGPMNRHLAARREREPAYRLAGDGVHIDAVGHWLVAREILLALGAPAAIGTKESVEAMLSAHPNGPELSRLIQQRQSVLKDAWLTATGHTRPGMAQGLPLAEAQHQAAALDAKIHALAAPFPGQRSDWNGFASDAEAIASHANPVDNLRPLANTRIPLLHVYGEADTVVPWNENTGAVAERYRQLGGSITLIAKPGVGHHPHGLADPAPIVDFIVKHAGRP